jgi:hypothetical protein
MTTTRRPAPRAWWLLAAAGLVLVIASCGVRPAATGPTPPSGTAQPSGSARSSGPTALISGVVEARPGCPVERPSRLCKPRPVGDVLVEARSRSAGVTASTRTRTDGHYSMRLGQGRYVLVAVTRQALPRCPHVPVSVTSPAAVHANIRCDSGIR